MRNDIPGSIMHEEFESKWQNVYSLFGKEVLAKTQSYKSSPNGPIRRLRVIPLLYYPRQRPSTARKCSKTTGLY